MGRCVAFLLLSWKTGSSADDCLSYLVPCVALLRFASARTVRDNVFPTHGLLAVRLFDVAGAVCGVSPILHYPTYSPSNRVGPLPLFPYLCSGLAAHPVVRLDDDDRLV